jgi:polygalacturonase
MMKKVSALSVSLLFLLLFVSFYSSTITQSQTTSRKAAGAVPATRAGAGVFDVKRFGARGDGKALDTPAINRAIDAAAASGGGTVFFSAGTYRCFSIRLKSNIALYLDQGATILAADPKDGDGKYDPPEPNQWDQYQDFGPGTHLGKRAGSKRGPVADESSE